VALLHPADLLFDIGLFAVTFVGAAVLLIVLASRSNRKSKGRLPASEGFNRAQRRRETAAAGRRRRR
jgi:hypothetical protein